MMFKSETKVRILTGKYKGLVGHPICYTVPHPLSSERRLQVKVQTGKGWVTLLMNENNVKILDNTKHISVRCNT